jgi:hypothetical protein
LEDWLKANRVDVADDDVVPADAAGKTRVVHRVLGKAAVSDGSDVVLVEYGSVGGAERLRKVVPVASLVGGGDGDGVVDRVYQLWLDRHGAAKSGGFGTLKQHLDLREREVHAGGGFDIVTPSHRATGLVALLGNLARAESMAGLYKGSIEDDDESPPLVIQNSADPCLNGASVLNVWWNEDDVGNPIPPPATNPPSSEVLANLLGVGNIDGMIEEVGGGHGLLQQLLAIQSAQPATRDWRFDQPRFSLRTRSLAIRLKSGRTEATPPLTLRSMVAVPPGRRLTKLVLLTLNRNSVPVKSPVISAAPSDAPAERESGAAAADEHDPKEMRKRQRLKRFERSVAPVISPETVAAAKAKAELFSTLMARKRSAPVSTRVADATMTSGGGDPMWSDYTPKKVTVKAVELLRLPWSKQAVRRRKWVEGPCTATCRDYHAVADVLNGTAEIPIVQPGGGGATSGASAVGPTIDVEITATPLVLLEKSKAVRAAEKRLIIAELELVQSETQLIAWRSKHSTGENTCRHTLQRTKAQREQAVAVAATALAKAQAAQLREWNLSATADTNDDEGGEAACTEPLLDASTTDDIIDAGIAPLVGSDQLSLVEDEDEGEGEVGEAGAPAGLDELLAACAEASEAIANQVPG